MTPEERAVIQAAIAFVYGTPELKGSHAHLLAAVEKLPANGVYTPVKACGHPSPTGAMTCTLERGHVLEGMDRGNFRFHQGFAKDGSLRTWREWR